MKEIRPVPVNLQSNENMNNKKTVVVAMSGGVDSSVAASLLKSQGFDVIGMMMRLWSEPSAENRPRFNRCCTPDQIADARRVAECLDIPFYVLDVQNHFYEKIVEFFIQEHLIGRTPNPCIECNRTIRFEYLLERALALGADFLATGHYARVNSTNGRFRLLKARDKFKDQSYVLHVLGQRELKHALFPIGDYNKDEVRALATRFKLPVAAKSESMDLCFLADGDYRRFLAEKSPGSNQSGEILTASGEAVGQHIGLPNYTIGQRKGLGVALGQPTFVIGKNISQNTLIVGTREQALKKEFLVRGVNWIIGTPPRESLRVHVKVRYMAKPVPASVSAFGNNQAKVVFDTPEFGVTAGQGAVFYCEDDCIGGGIIADE